MPKIILLFFPLLALGVGIMLGGLMFSDSLSRTFLDVASCHDVCFKQNEVAGLLASLGIQNFGANLPTAMYETDKTIVFDIQYPYPPDKIHYVVVPKKDIKNIGQISPEDLEYLQDSFAVISNIVQENNYHKYRVITNGPGYQEVTYLHFHLVVDRD